MRNLEESRTLKVEDASYLSRIRKMEAARALAREAVAKGSNGDEKDQIGTKKRGRPRKRDLITIEAEKKGRKLKRKTKALARTLRNLKTEAERLAKKQKRHALMIENAQSELEDVLALCGDILAFGEKKIATTSGKPKIIGERDKELTAKIDPVIFVRPKDNEVDDAQEKITKGATSKPLIREGELPLRTVTGVAENDLPGESTKPKAPDKPQPISVAPATLKPEDEETANASETVKLGETAAVRTDNLAGSKITMAGIRKTVKPETTDRIIVPWKNPGGGQNDTQAAGKLTETTTGPAATIAAIANDEKNGRVKIPATPEISHFVPGEKSITVVGIKGASLDGSAMLQISARLEHALGCQSSYVHYLPDGQRKSRRYENLIVFGGGQWPRSILSGLLPGMEFDWASYRSISETAGWANNNFYNALCHLAKRRSR